MERQALLDLLGGPEGRLELAPRLDLQNLELSPMEGFVLSRLGGGGSRVRELCQLTGLPEEQTLRILVRLRQSGVLLAITERSNVGPASGSLRTPPGRAPLTASAPSGRSPAAASPNRLSPSAAPTPSAPPGRLPAAPAGLSGRAPSPAAPVAPPTRTKSGHRVHQPLWQRREGDVNAPPPAAPGRPAGSPPGATASPVPPRSGSPPAPATTGATRGLRPGTPSAPPVASSPAPRATLCASSSSVFPSPGCASPAASGPSGVSAGPATAPPATPSAPASPVRVQDRTGVYRVVRPVAAQETPMAAPAEGDPRQPTRRAPTLPPSNGAGRPPVATAAAPGAAAAGASGAGAPAAARPADETPEFRSLTPPPEEFERLAAEAFPVDAAALVEEVEIPVSERRLILYLHERRAELDYYQLLAVSHRADKSALRKAFLRRTQLFHPDRYFRRAIGSYAPRLHELYKAVSVAYDTLVDPRSRSLYDKTLQLTALPGGVNRAEQASRLYEEGKKLSDSGDFLGAIRALEQAAELEPRNERYHVLLLRVRAASRQAGPGRPSLDELG